MKNQKSIFIKIGLLMLPIILALEAFVLILTYNITYESNLERCKQNIQNAAVATAKYCEAVDLYDTAVKIQGEGSFDQYCVMFDVTYIYAVKVDPVQNSETYLVIGFGEDASEEAKRTRYIGCRVEGQVTEEELEAYNGNTEGVFYHYTNHLDDTLVCYMPVMSYYSSSDYSYHSYDAPIIIGAEISLNGINRSFGNRFWQIALLTIIITVLMIVLFGTILYFMITKPLRRISERMNSFVSDRDKGLGQLPVKGSDELAQMSRSFNTMTVEINRYIDDIDALNREKHTREAEMNIARNIQKGLLQPENYDSRIAALRAYMLPARDVGGDLYDYRILDDGRVFAAIGDVAGKGITAALFMSRAITLLHQNALRGCSPAEILTEFNNTLAEYNPGGLFITTFVAVWDPATGELTYSNAGHNYPYILSDKLTALTGAHGVTAGLFPGEVYENATVKLSGGEVLFMYTDGVNEAKNTDGSFYKNERLERQLARCYERDDSDPIDVVLDDLNRFTEGAEQNDDITMLALRIKRLPSPAVITLPSEIAQLPRVKEAIFSLPIGEDFKKKLFLAAEEIFVNICSYAYDGTGEVGLRLSVDPNGVEMVFSDSGKPFDPTEETLDIDEYDHENSIGGLGRFLTFSIADRYRYEYRDGKNHLYLYFDEVK